MSVFEAERNAQRISECIRIIRHNNFKPSEAFGPPRPSDGHRLFIGGGFVTPLQYMHVMNNLK